MTYCSTWLAVERATGIIVNNSGKFEDLVLMTAKRQTYWHRDRDIIQTCYSIVFWQRMLAWLSVWSEVQTCVWPSWCHCYSLSRFSNIQVGFTFLVLAYPGSVCVCVCEWLNGGIAGFILRSHHFGLAEFFVAAVHLPRNIWPPPNFNLISHHIVRQNTVHLTLDSPYVQW